MRKTGVIIFILCLLYTAFPVNAQEAAYKRREFLYRKKPASLPNFYFSDGQNRKIQIGEFKGKVIVLNMWGQNCKTCVYELPMFSRLQKDLGNQVKVISLSIGPESVIDVMRLYQSLNIYNLDVYKDWNGKFAEMLNIKTIPTTMLIDPEGREVARLTGMAEWDGPLIKSQVLALISEYKK